MTKNIDIPNGWEVKKLGEVVEKSFYGTSNPTKKNGKYPVLKMANLDNGKVVLSNIEFIDLTDEEFNKIKLIKDDILFNRTNSEELVGKIAIFDLDINCVAASYIVIFRINQNISLPLYLNFLLNTDIYKNNVKQFISKGVSQCNINQNTLQNHLNILLPPLAEQEKIAEILSLWNKAIEQTKELIAYKEKQKKGLMQNLLTGKKRLHGFNDKWKTVKLGDIFKITSAGVDKKILEHEIKINLLNYMDIYNNNLISNKIINFMTSAPKNKILNCNILKGDVFLTPSSETRDDIAHSSVAIEDLQDTVYSYHIVRLRPKEQINLLFSKYMFDNDFFRKQAYSLCEGSGQRYVLSLSILNHLKLKIPTSLDEQEAIADILCKADEEIELLNKQLDLYTEQKKGLMQNLLTGKVRVTV